ncbi:MAG: class I SAM-dependent methyltransferase [Eubacteriaceae bacterium]|nr:class I SAM-dependent methyltransferase [Eubacteriaceae bacterium]
MQEEIDDKLAVSLSADTTELLPFVPYLLQDFWELGSDPIAMCCLIEKQVDVPSGMKVLDLACGKGAVSVRIAERFNARVKGVDIMPEFIKYALQKAAEYNVAGLCGFATGDVNEAVANERGYDVVVFGAAGVVLGEPAQMLDKLKAVINTGGHMLIDECYLPENVKQSDLKSNSYELLTEKQWADLFGQAGLELVGVDFGKDNNTPASGCADEGMAFITARAKELASKHHGKNAMFEAYVNNQLNEYVIWTICLFALLGCCARHFD